MYSGTVVSSTLSLMSVESRPTTRRYAHALQVNDTVADEKGLYGVKSRACAADHRRGFAPSRQPAAGVATFRLRSVGHRACLFNISHAARCTARQGVAACAVPLTIECAIPTGKKFGR